MTKTFSAALHDEIRQDLSRLVTCFKVTRSDGKILGFTDHSARLTISSISYEPETGGFTRSAIESDSDLSVDNLEIDGFLESQRLTEEDLRAGRYDDADIEIFLVNHQDPTGGTIVLKTGRLGEVALAEEVFSAKIHGLSDRLRQTFLDVTTPDCRVDLFSAECGVATAAFTDTGVVSVIKTQSRKFDATMQTSRANGFHDGGLLTWKSGANAGLSKEVKDHTDSGADFQFTLFESMPSALAVGDIFEVGAGCDKRATTCRDKFSNIVNFRGEPFIPGIDKVGQTPDAK